jgi:hypothetical protein
MQDYRKIRAYPESLDLVAEVYRLTGKLPYHQRFTLASQLQRAVVSVPMNIAEGAGRSTRPDFARFIDQALGSTNEVECVQVRVENVRRMLSGFVKTLRLGRRKSMKKRPALSVRET